MGAVRNLVGQKFGRLTVISRVENDKFGKACWKCLCDCGNTCVVATGALTTGNTRSCGCFQRDRVSETFIKDLTGKRFGRLTVIRQVENSRGSRSVPTGYVQYECLCDCGKKCIVKAGNLSSGDTKSCGCLNDEKRLDNFNDLTGMKFGRLSVIKRVDNNKYGKTCWLCKCDCGNECVVLGTQLTQGLTQSCGCLRLENLRKVITKWTPEESELLDNHFSEMIQRCYNPNNPGFKDYGGRGIVICDEWLMPPDGRRAFVDWAFSHGYSKGLTIERNDVNGNYCPENCCWIPRSKQSLNTRKSVRVCVKGNNLTLSQWSDFLCYPYWRLKYMYRKYGLDAVRTYLEQYVKG